MKTRLRILNLLLIAFCCFIGWQMRANHLDHQNRMERTFSHEAADPQPGDVAIDPMPAAPAAAEFSEVAMRTLFAQDRNPAVVEEKKPEPPPKKMPDLPVLHGVMDLGEGPIAMMSSASGDLEGNFKVGDSIGEFEIVKIATDRITFRWDGKEVTKLSSELRTAAVRPAAPAAAKPAAAEPPKPAAPVKPGPGKDLGGRERACQTGDTSPDGTVVDGYVKRTVYMPMGPVCTWEPVQKN